MSAETILNLELYPDLKELLELIRQCGERKPEGNLLKKIKEYINRIVKQKLHDRLIFFAEHYYQKKILARSIIKNRSNYSLSLLHYAILCNCPVAVEELLKADADPNTIDTLHFSPPILYSAQELVRSFIYPQNFHAIESQKQIIKLLCQHARTDINQMSSMTKDTLIVMLSRDDNCVTLLIEIIKIRPELNIHHCNNNGLSALHRACIMSAEKTAEVLLDTDKCDFERLNSGGLSPVIIACRNGLKNALKQMITRELDINNVYYRDHNSTIQRTTCLHEAAIYKQIELVKILVEEYGADINAVNSYELTPVMGACIYGSLEVVNYLIGKGAVVDSIANDFGNILNIAYMFKHQAIIEYLEGRNIIRIKSKEEVLTSIEHELLNESDVEISQEKILTHYLDFLRNKQNDETVVKYNLLRILDNLNHSTLTENGYKFLFLLIKNKTFPTILTPELISIIYLEQIRYLWGIKKDISVARRMSNSLLEFINENRLPDDYITNTYISLAELYRGLCRSYTDDMKELRNTFSFLIQLLEKLEDENDAYVDCLNAIVTVSYDRYLNNDPTLDYLEVEKYLKLLFEKGYGINKIECVHLYAVSLCKLSSDVNTLKEALKLLDKCMEGINIPHASIAKTRTALREKINTINENTKPKKQNINPENSGSQDKHSFSKQFSPSTKPTFINLTEVSIDKIPQKQVEAEQEVKAKEKHHLDRQAQRLKKLAIKQAKKMAEKPQAEKKAGLNPKFSEEQVKHYFCGIIQPDDVIIPIYDKQNELGKYWARLNPETAKKDKNLYEPFANAFGSDLDEDNRPICFRIMGSHAKTGIAITKVGPKFKLRGQTTPRAYCTVYKFKEEKDAPILYDFDSIFSHENISEPDTERVIVIDKGIDKPVPLRASKTVR